MFGRQHFGGQSRFSYREESLVGDVEVKWLDGFDWTLVRPLPEIDPLNSDGELDLQFTEENECSGQDNPIGNTRCTLIAAKILLNKKKINQLKSEIVMHELRLNDINKEINRLRVANVKLKKDLKKEV